MLAYSTNSKNSVTAGSYLEFVPLRRTHQSATISHQMYSVAHQP